MSWGARDRRELEVLHRVALALAHSLEFPAVMDALSRELTHAVERACECTISTWNERADELEVASVYRREGGISEIERGVAYRLVDFPHSRDLLRAAEGHSELRATDLQTTDDVRLMLGSWGWRSWIELPLVVDGRSVGLIELADYRSARTWSWRDRQFCQTIAGQAALAVRNAQMYASLQLRVDRDPLTGLLDHGAFHRQLEAELVRAHAAGEPLIVALIDLDDFKAVNDARGHVAGDRALRRVAEALRTAAPDAPAIGRLGGDEFGLVLRAPDDPAAVAAGLLDEVCSRTGLALSIGAALSSPYDRTGSDVLHRADASLIDAKRSGKRTFRLAV